MASLPARRRRRGLGLTRNVLLLSAASFLTDISSEMSLTFLPFFLANVLGARTCVIGIVEGVADSAASLTRILSGWLSDVWRRKPLVIAGYTISAISKPFLYFVQSWTAVLGVRFADRLGKGIRTSPRDALLAASASTESRGLAFGFHRGADTAGAFLGLLGIALVIYLSQGWTQQLQETAFRRLVLIAVAPAVLAVVVLAALRETPPARAEVRLSRKRGAPLSRRFKLFLASVAVFSLANSSDAFLLLRTQNLGLSVLGVALLLAAFNLGYSVISPLAGTASDRLGRPALVGAGWVVYALTYLGFGLATEAWQVWPLFALYAVYYGLAEGTARALVADLVPDAQRGTAYGFYHTVVGLAALPASLLAGLVWQGIGDWGGWGPAAPFLLGAAFAAAGAALFALAMRGFRPAPQHEGEAR